MSQKANSHNHSFIGELRYSRDMRLFRAITLGLGLSLGVGVLVLLGPVAQSTGAREPWAFLIAGALFLPTALSLAELAAASGPEAAYHLIPASERPLFSYLTGWALLGGGVALGGLLARSTADYISSLAANFLDLSLTPHWLSLAIVLLLTANNILGSRENRWWQNAIVVVSLATLLLLSGWAWFTFPYRPSPTGQTFLNTTAAVALLGGSLWGLVLILAAGGEMRHLRKDVPRASVASLGMGSISGAAIAAIVLRVLGKAAAQPLPLANLAERLGGTTVQGWMLVVGVATLGVSLNRSILTLGRIATDMSRAGFLPQSWRVTHSQFHTPYWLLAGGGVLTALASVHGDVILLAALAGFNLLGATALVNIPTILSQASYLPDKRPLKLPFSPLIPGVAIAINLLLLTALPVEALIIGLGWFLIGAIVYALYARQGAAAARTGVTVFREEPEARAEVTYRVLVPIANPATAEALISTGSALARAYEGEVLALQVVVVPEQTSLLSGRRSARQQWSLLDQAVKRAQAVGVPVHSAVRIAHSAVEGILDTAHEEKCDLILMGWRGDPNTRQSFELGPVIDEVVDQAPCNVAVLKGELPDQLECIVVPTAGGPHAPAAVQIGLDLVAKSKAKVIALNLVRGPLTAAARQEAQAKIDQTLEDVEDDTRISRRVARADDIKRGILEEAAVCDLLLLGASEEGVLDQITFGGLPEDIARASPKPVILVRRYRGLRQFWLRRLWQGLYALFPSLDRPEQIEVYRTMRRGARPDIDFFVLIVLSAVIATLGLLQGSAAVIIGAMLVAPLMTPILAISLGVVQGDVRLIRLALESALKGITLALVVAVAMVSLTPYSGLTPEMMARAHPTLLDLIVALASGAAGAYASGRKEVAAALPGVAIAAALVPPLCVAGAGIALSRPDVAGGALLLFITNLIAISMAGAIIFLLLGFRPTRDEHERQRRFRQGLAVTLALALIISVPLGFFLVKTVREGQRKQAVVEVLDQEANAIGARFVNSEMQPVDQGFRVVATFYAPEPPDRNTVKRIQGELSRAIGAPVRLEIIVVPIARVPAE